MKKVLFFALFLIFLGAASVNAQVTIGKNVAPHPASVLDLRSTNKGLLLPRVDISDANTFQLSTGREDEAIGLTVYNTNNAMLNGQGAGIYAWSGSKWMIVSSDGNGPAVPVTNLTINFPTTALRAGNSAVAGNSGNSAESGDTIQFSVDVQPGNATNPNCRWSVVPGGGTSSITPEGQFIAGSPGDVTVRATATDGSGIYGEIRVTVNPPAVPVTSCYCNILPDNQYQGGLLASTPMQLSAWIFPDNATNRNVIWSVVSETTRGIVTVDRKLVTATNVGSGTAVIRATSAADPSKYSDCGLSVTAIATDPPGPGTVTGANGTYKTYCYPGTVGCWMIENSKEGTPAFTTYPDKQEGERGYYGAGCPDGWRVPSLQAWRVLIGYVKEPSTPTEHKNHWIGSELAGYIHYWHGEPGQWQHWGEQATYAHTDRSLSTVTYDPYADVNTMGITSWGCTRCSSIGTTRCIKSK
jgi:hypothetical protein